MKKHLVAPFAKQKTFKSVRYGDKDFHPISDGLAIYKGKMYGSKDDLKYMPKSVRLVRLPR